MVVIVKEKNGKIEITKEELQKALDEAYEEGKNSVVAYPVYVPGQSPYKDWWNWPPVTWTADSTGSIGNTITTSNYSNETTIKEA